MNRPHRLRDATVPLRKIIPNLFTTAALCSGVASLHFTNIGDWRAAVGAVGMAALLDGLDGRAARLLKATTRFGETFDSMADFVAFGLAPAFLVYRWCGRGNTLWGISLDGLLVITVVLFVFCSALRLARFTAMQRRKKAGAKPSKFFVGMPTPAAAGAALIPPMLELSPTLGARLPVVLVIALLLTIAGLMISRLPMFSGKRIRISRAWAVPLMVLMALVVAGFVRDAWLTACLLAAAYLGSLPISIRSARRQPESEAAAVAPATDKPADVAKS